MRSRSIVLTVVGVMLLAGAPLLAQGPFQGGFQPGDGNHPFAQFFEENSEMLENLQHQFAQGGFGHGMFSGGSSAGFFGGRGSRGRGNGLTSFLLAEYIGLTDAQKTVLEEAREDARVEMLAQMKALGENRQKIREAAANSDTALLHTLAQDQGDLIASMIVARATARGEIEELLALTDEQKAKIEKLKQHFKDKADERRNVFKSWFGGEAPAQP